MSLRDQLLAKGLASKKDARQVNRDLKKKRKKNQSQREKKHLVTAKAADQKVEEETHARHVKQVARKARETESSQVEQEIRVRQLIAGNRIAHVGRTVFHFKKMGGRRLGRLEVSEGVAWMLRCGEAAIAGQVETQREVYTVISSKAAHRLLEIAPHQVVFFTTDNQGISNADEAFLKRTWETTLGPHRQRTPTTNTSGE
jgi:hypothetical protein